MTRWGFAVRTRTRRSSAELLRIFRSAEEKAFLRASTEKELFAALNIMSARIGSRRLSTLILQREKVLKDSLSFSSRFGFSINGIAGILRSLIRRG